MSVTAPSTGSTTMYGDGLPRAVLQGSTKNTSETVYVGGAGGQYMGGGLGENIFKYLSPSDSPYTSQDVIGMDPAKDLIDLSAIDANPAEPGVQHFTFIGDKPFDSKGAEVRTQYIASQDEMLVEVNMAGDDFYQPDMVIRVYGTGGHLTAANFVSTPDATFAGSAPASSGLFHFT
jgi:hypothetical protein